MATATTDAAPGRPRRRRRRRRHGLEAPLHPQQVCGWLALGVLGAGAFLLLVPALSAPLRTPFRATLASLFAVHLASHLAATLLDPAEPELRRQPRPRDPQPLPPGAAPIARGRCRLCEIRLSGARTKHCGACDKCVAGFDHHCKWLNQCVGARNYAVFAMSVASAAAGSTLMAAVAAAEVALLHSSPGVSAGWIAVPAEEASLPFGGGTAFQAAVVVLGVLSAIAAALLLHLGAFHIYIAVRGLTTYEYIRSHRNAVAPVSFPSNQQPTAVSSQPVRSAGCCRLQAPPKPPGDHHRVRAWCCRRNNDDEANAQPVRLDMEQTGEGKPFAPYILPPPSSAERRKCGCCLENRTAPQKPVDVEYRDSLENAGQFEVKKWQASYLASPAVSSSHSSRKVGCCCNSSEPESLDPESRANKGSPALPRTFVSYLFCALGSREASDAPDLPQQEQQLSEQSINTSKTVSSYSETPPLDGRRPRFVSCCGSGSELADNHELQVSPDRQSSTSCKCGEGAQVTQRRCCQECSSPRTKPRCSLCLCVGGGGTSRVSPDTRRSCCHRSPAHSTAAVADRPPPVAVISDGAISPPPLDKDLLKAPVPRRRWTSAVCGSGVEGVHLRPETLPPPPPQSPPQPPPPSSQLRPPCTLPALPPPARRRIRSVSQLQELSAALALVQNQSDLAALRQAFVTSQRRQQRLRTIQQQQRARSPRLSPIRESGLSNPGSPRVTVRNGGGAAPTRADTDPTPTTAGAHPPVRTGTWISAEH